MENLFAKTPCVKMSMKNYHKMEWIRPEKIFEALVYLKQHHPEYSNIDITDCNEWMKDDGEIDNTAEWETNSDDSDEEQKMQ